MLESLNLLIYFQKDLFNIWEHVSTLFAKLDDPWCFMKKFHEKYDRQHYFTFFILLGTMC
jgi:hypothetical protein